MFLIGKLEYLLGNHKEALEILKEIPVKDDFVYKFYKLFLCKQYYCDKIIIIFIFFRETGECSSVLINNNVGCLYHYAKKPALSFTSIHKAISQHQKNISDVTKKPAQGRDYTDYSLNLGNSKYYTTINKSVTYFNS